MAKKKKMTDEQIAADLASMLMKDMRGIPVEEKEARIKKFGERVTKARASRPARATSSDGTRISPNPVYARGR